MTVYVLGWDGAEPELVEEYLADGDLPNLERLREEGSFGEMRSVYPPMTPCAWTSFMTGKNPGGHGIFDFEVRNGDGEFKLVTSSDVGSETLYDILDRRGLKVGSLGIPLTYPPPEIDGYVVPGLPIDSVGPEKVHPDWLWEEIEEVGGLSIHDENFAPGKEDEYVEAHHRQIDRIERAFFHLDDVFDLDLHMVLFPNSDTMAHWMWRYQDSEHPDYPGENPHEDCLRDVYSRLDDVLGRLMDEMEEEDRLVLMSDHGFGPVHKNLFMNERFASEGLLEFKRSTATSFRRLVKRIGLTPARGYRLASRLGFRDVLDQAEQSEGGSILKTVALAFMLSDSDVDWERTRAYVKGNFGQVYVKGDLQGEERDAALEKAEEVLLSAEDPETGETIVEEVHRREEIYSGSCMENAPDLLFMTRGLKYMPARMFEFGSNRLVEGKPLRNGHHKMDGIVGLWGPGIEEGRELERREITDVLPTLFHMLDVPVLADVDGDPISPAFEEDVELERVEKESLDGLDF